MKKLAGLFALMLAFSCQKVDFMETGKDARSDTEHKDSTERDVEIEVTPEGWGAPINVGFGFGPK